MKKKIIMLFLSIILFILAACTDRIVTEIDSSFSKINEVKLSEEAKVAQKFLQDKDFQVLAYSSRTSSSYKLTEEKLNDIKDQYENYKWALQGISTDNYIGKTIFNERFIVKNHSLDNWKSGSLKSEGKTYVDVIVVEGKAIGGISAPYTKEQLVGMPYSLDGKTLDEIRNNI
jgi:protein involved in sex pheromone biosynthesis